MVSAIASICRRFQSTLPARGATGVAILEAVKGRFQSTLPARGATLAVITAMFSNRFQSTLPARGATRSQIHAQQKTFYFNPRSPRGERPRPDLTDNCIRQFQSTLPARGATKLIADLQEISQISIHAPREGSDIVSGFDQKANSNFNPRSPRGERPIFSLSYF